MQSREKESRFHYLWFQLQLAHHSKRDKQGYFWCFNVKQAWLLSKDSHFWWETIYINFKLINLSLHGIEWPLAASFPPINPTEFFITKFSMSYFIFWRMCLDCKMLVIRFYRFFKPCFLIHSSHGGWVFWDTGAFSSSNQSSTDPVSNPAHDYIETLINVTYGSDFVWRFAW